MIEHFSPAAAASMADGDERRRAVLAAQEIGVPNTETEEWRYSPIGELPLDQLVPVVDDPGAGAGAGAGASVDRYTDVIAQRAATVVAVDGWIVDAVVENGWEAKGLAITFGGPPEVAVEGEETVFDLLHRAFSPAPLVIEVPAGLCVDEPIVILTHHSGADRASFPHLVVQAGESSEVEVVERQTSDDGFGLSVPVVDLRAGPGSRLRYLSVQELGRGHWQLGRLRSAAAGQATLVSGIAAFGAAYARLRADCHLTGRGATGNLVAAYYGDGEQVHDFRIFQHHDARDTRSDLLFKGAQDGSSGSIYTGMIHIHADGAGSNAFQTNRNIKLGPDAWAWSVPNLEIENNDVRCSHASTVSPVDEDQRFYLHSRGVPPIVADRLIVAGFFDEVIGRLPVAAARGAVRRHIADKLDRRDTA